MAWHIELRHAGPLVTATAYLLAQVLAAHLLIASPLHRIVALVLVSCSA